MEADFSGYATKAGLVCSDGRTIMPDAFKHQDKMTVPLVWQHGHTTPTNVLGHAVLENRADGVYAYCFFNKTEHAQHARELVEHKDIKHLSIWANQLVEKAKSVFHGAIREVSLVLGGANPGALIDNVTLRHSDGTEDILEEDVIIYTDIEIEHSSVKSDDTVVTKTDVGAKTVESKQDLYDTMTPEQKELVHSMLAKALSDDDSPVVDEDKEQTPQETYDSMNPQQKEMLHSMIAEALDQDSLAHAEDDLTVGEVYEAMTEEQKQLVHFMIGQALSGEELQQSDMTVEHADGGNGKTVKEVYDSMTEVQKQVLHFMVGEALEAAGDAKHSDDDGTDNGTNNNDQEGKIVKHNVFEGDTKTDPKEFVLSHDDMAQIFTEAKAEGSFKAALEGYALAHGINDIELLFPDAMAVDAVPEWLKRQTEWVSVFLGGARKVPFSKIKSLSADLTEEAARAKGYIKGNLKKEEFFKVARRTTSPTTVYKKQKLDRDDIVDITDFDIVAWLKAEMRMMLDEEIARAGLLGDGRAADDEDKIDEDCIRPIATDHELYAVKVYVNLGDANSAISEVSDAIITARSQYKGTGNPIMFTTETYISRFLILKDSLGRKIYKNLDELKTELRVSAIVPVEVMEEYPDIIAVLVNPADYTYGATKGGEVNNFEDFDIDYNQYKYLSETRCSGTLTKLKSAIVLVRTADNSVLVVPAVPTFDPETGELTINDTANVVYKHGTDVVTEGASPYTVPSGTTWTIDATPASGYHFATSDDDSWNFTAD